MPRRTAGKQAVYAETQGNSAGVQCPCQRAYLRSGHEGPNARLLALARGSESPQDDSSHNERDLKL